MELIAHKQLKFKILYNNYKNMNTRIFITLTLIFAITILIGCKKDADVPATIDPLSGLTKLEEAYVPGAATKIQIWGTKNFYAGYNKLTVVLYDSVNSTQKVTRAHVEFSPMMTMPGMQHGGPVENPDSVATNNVFTGAIIFPMATMNGGTWQLPVHVHNHVIDKEGDVSFNITVDQPTQSIITNFTSSADSTQLFLAVVQPFTPKVGLNDVEFAIYEKLGMFTWPAADSTYSISLDPEMPSMGHGSTGNVNATYTSPGHYKGKVDYSMTGAWQLNVTVNKSGVAVSKGLYFTNTIQ
jgi:YtkA-like